MKAKEKIIALVNAANAEYRPFQLDELILGMPLTYLGERNTVVTLSAAPRSGFTDTRDIFYDRLDLGTTLVPDELYSETPFTVDDILNQYRLLTDVEITESDVSVTDFSQQPYVSQTVTVTAKLDSLGWRGQKEFTLYVGLPPNTEELYRWMNFDLPEKFNN